MKQKKEKQKKEEAKPAAKVEKKANEKQEAAPVEAAPAISSSVQAGSWTIFQRVNKSVPERPKEIKPHPHGVELGVLIQMLKDSSARTLRAMLCQDFSRVVICGTSR